MNQVGCAEFCSTEPIEAARGKGDARLTDVGRRIDDGSWIGGDRRGIDGRLDADRAAGKQKPSRDSTECVQPRKHVLAAHLRGLPERRRPLGSGCPKHRLNINAGPFLDATGKPAESPDLGLWRYGALVAGSQSLHGDNGRLHRRAIGEEAAQLVRRSHPGLLQALPFLLADRLRREAE